MNETETPGDRWERERWEAARKMNSQALEVLGPLGFVDNDDGECPGAIWHAATGLTFDVTIVPPAGIIAAVMERGMARGREEVRAAARKAFGL